MSRRVVIEADGGSRGNPGPAGYGAVVRDVDTGEVLAEVAEAIGVASNNVAEYRGLIAGLAAAVELGATEVEARMDSKLVVEQMAGRWQVKHPDMKRLRLEAQAWVDRLPRVRFTHIPRARNAYADRLANAAMDAAARGEVWRPEEPAVPVASDTPVTSTWVAPPAAGATVTLLLRHGSTAMTAERRFSGVSDPELTELGRSQAYAAARRLRGLDVAAVYSSPLRRAFATAEALGLDVIADERLRETDFGAWEGLTYAEVQAGWPDELAAWLADTSVAPPGGESFAATAGRVEAARADVVAKHPGEVVLVVSHVTPIKMLLRTALGGGPGLLYRIHLDPCGLSRVDWHPGNEPVARAVNDTGHLT